MTNTSLILRIEDGILAGTEIKQVLGGFGEPIIVQYPHRKTSDMYLPPMEKDGKKTTLHCCQDSCPNPDFEGKPDSLMAHLMLHKGRLLRPWTRKAQLKSPMPAVRIPKNSWDDAPKGERNQDRQFCVSLYIESLKDALRRQGIELLE